MEFENLEAKIDRVFTNAAIDKRRLAASGLKNRGVPGYVAEWVLETVVPGHGELSSADANKVQEWASRVIPKADEGNAIRNRLLAGERVKILTRVQIDVTLGQTKAVRNARLALIGIFDGRIGEDIIKQNPQLLNHGMWGVVELVYLTGQGVVITNFRPMQADANLDDWNEARAHFTIEEWRAVLLRSMGYNPDFYSPEQQMLVLARLLPLVQKHTHLIELAPRGTGKSYVYENISPQVRLISGGNVSPAVLFVNNTNGQGGLLTRYAVVVLDEVQTLKFESPAEIVGGLKGYMANGRITRGGLHEFASDCSFVLLANITLDSQSKPVNDPITQELPSFLQETAFIERIKGLIPGWEIPKLEQNSFALGFGLKADYFGDILVALRSHHSASDTFCARNIDLGERAYHRNKEAVTTLASGYMKLLFPHVQPTLAEFYTHCLKPAIKLRQGVWNLLYSQGGEYRKFDRAIVPILSE
ncbi:BREX system Lon protease-like protein BrxL [Rufibacter sp. LB8]|uniref:BREX system Lon protease-like protein BrxL n=1 Tax=Rufibacter sp. LB8 TaxID=2777781 RepID=UPI00178C41D6|nr:BREX system Lon protease-like protein BrxL [Rufibacter sp. LB8]